MRIKAPPLPTDIRLQFPNQFNEQLTVLLILCGRKTGKLGVVVSILDVMNWSRKLRFFEVIIAGVVPLKLCLADIQLELFTRTSSGANLYVIEEQAAPVRHSPLDEIAMQVRSWKGAGAQSSDSIPVTDPESGESASEGIVITDESYNPRFAERLQDFIFSRYRRLNSGE